MRLWQLTALYLLPLTVWCLLRDRQARAAFIMWRAQLRIILGGICMSVWMMIFYMSLEHTSILHACLFSNVHSVVIVIANLVCCRPTACGELLGVLLSIAGGVVMLSGPPAGNVNVGWDMACIGAAMFGTVYLVSTENLRVNIPLVLFMPEMMTVAAIASGAYSVLHEVPHTPLIEHPRIHVQLTHSRIHVQRTHLHGRAAAHTRLHDRLASLPRLLWPWHIAVVVCRARKCGCPIMPRLSLAGSYSAANSL